MFDTRWKKGGRDLWQHKGLSFTVLASVAVSVFLLGVILFSYSILSREMNAGFANARPHAVSFRLDAFQEDLLEDVRRRPDVGAVEARRVVVGRIQRASGDWVPLLLYVLRDYDDVVLDVVVPEQGAWPPGNGELLVERQALSVLQGALGHTYAVASDEGLGGRLRLSGLAYDVVLPQAEMENLVYGYATFETLQRLGAAMFFNELSLTFSDESLNLDQIRRKTTDLRGWLTEEGYTVTGVDIPLPGRHPHHDITRGMFIIQEVFSVLLSLFIGILIFNLVSAMLSGQIRQIGVMKAVGAQAGQIGSLYFGSILCLGLAGLILALPLAVAGGDFYAGQVAVMMNFDIEDDGAAGWTYLVVIGLGLCLPLLTAVWPVWRASRIPVRETLVDYGLSRKHGERSVMERLVGKLSFLGRPVSVGLRNAFRRKGRLVLMTGVLSIGAAFYMSALNLDVSTTALINTLQAEKAWGLRVRLDGAHAVEDVTSQLEQVAGVRQVEPFFQTEGALLDEGGQTILTVPVTAVYPASDMLRQPFLDGRWLGGDGEDLVINQYLARRMPQLVVGSEVTLLLDNRRQVFRISGIVKTLGGHQAYVGYPAYVASAGLTDRANGFYLVGARDDRAYLQDLEDRVQASLKQGSYDVRGIATAWDGLEVLEDHFVIIFNMILTLTVVIVLVAGNGIVLSMRANILERTREIGVLKAIGASNGMLYRIILGESVVIGVASWLLAVVVMLPISSLIGYGVGAVLVQAPLPLVLSSWGIAGSLPVVLLVAALACLAPVRSIARRSVRAALLYE